MERLGRSCALSGTPPPSPTLSADHGPAGADDSAVRPASSADHEDRVAETASSAEYASDDPGGGAADDDPGGGSINPTEDDSAPIVSNTPKNPSSPLLSSSATGLTSSRTSSSIVEMDEVSDYSDDNDGEYKGHFCSSCSIPPPGGVRRWVCGLGAVGFDS